MTNAMNTVWFVLLVLSSADILTRAVHIPPYTDNQRHDKERSNLDLDRLEADVLSLQLKGLTINDERRAVYGCKEQSQSCGGSIKCCSPLICFQSNIYAATAAATCRECLPNGHKCQSDNQCCEGLSCRKNSSWNREGHCS